MSGHTPGPWTVGTFKADMVAGPHEALSVHPPWARPGQMGAHICLVAPRKRAKAVDHANANLIAAAPDLLEAARSFEALLGQVTCVGDFQELTRRDREFSDSELARLWISVGRQAQAAIAKAEGR